MKRVLFVRRTYGFGGAEIVLLDWLKRIDYSQYEVFVSSPADVFSKLIADYGLPAKFIHLSEKEVTHIYGRYHPEIGINDLVRGSFWHFFPIWLGFVWRIRPDIVSFQDGDFFTTPLACVLAAFVVTMGNVSMTIHNSFRLEEPPPQKTSTSHFGLPGLGLWWYRQVWWPTWPWRVRQKLVRRVLTVSRVIGEKVVSFYGYPASKMGLVNHGVDTTRFQPCQTARVRWRREHDIPEDAFVIASTSRLNSEKNVDLLVNAFEGIASSNREVWLLVAGDGPLRKEIEILVGKCCAKDRIRLLGHVDDVCPMLQAADAYVLASKCEGRSIAMMEAMAVGLICLVSRIPGADEVVEHGRDGFLIEPSQEGVFAGLQEMLAMTVPKRQRMSLCARERIVEQHELEKGIESYFAELGIEPAKPIPVATSDSRVSQVQEAVH